MKLLTRLSIICALLVSSFPARSCSSWIGREGYRIGLFLPYTYYKPWLGMLQYEMDDAYDPDISLAIDHDRDLNCMEWKNYCGATVKKEDIYFVMYEMPPGYFLGMIDYPLDKTKSEYSNTFIRWLLKKENAPSLKYMKFAKTCESISMQRLDPWDEDITDFDERWGKHYDEGWLEMENCKDDFLYQRWVFQFNRRHAYGAAQGDHVEGAAKRANDDKLKSDLVRGWTYAYMYHIAADETIDAVDKNIFLAKAFDLTADKKYFAVKYFSSSHLQQTIQRLYDQPHLRAVVYGLAALNRQDECMDLVRKIIQEDVNSDIFEIVLTREIQKIEDELMTEKITGFHAASANTGYSIYYEKELMSEYYDKKEMLKHISTNNFNRVYFQGYAQLLLKMLDDILAKKQLTDPAFVHLAASHLNWCLKNSSGMQHHLDQVQNTLNRSNPLNTLFGIETVLQRSLEQKGFDENTEALVLDILTRKDRPAGYDEQDLHDQFCMAVMDHYERSGDLYKATLLMQQVEGLYKAIAVDGHGENDYTNTGSRYFAGKATVNDADKLNSFLNRKHYNAFEKFLVQPFAKDSARYDILMEWVGSVYVRNEKWEKALYAFGKVDPGYWKLTFKENEYDKKFKGLDMYRWTYYPSYLDADPFVARVTHNHSGSLPDSLRYNKYTFVKKWLKLQKQSGSGNPRVRDNALLQLAHARYNMTWYGNSWIMWRNEWSAYEHKYWPGFEKDYFACERARAAYDQLFRLTKNRDIQSRCCIMLAICERNKNYYNHREKHDYKYKGGNYLDMFMKKYADTKTHENIMTSCMGEEEFLNFVNLDEGY